MADRTPLCRGVDALGWRGGDRLHFSLIGGSMVVHRDASGAFAMPN